MKNINILVENNILTITVDLTKTFGKSKSGKTTIVASTEGNIPIVGGAIVIGMNVYK